VHARDLQMSCTDNDGLALNFDVNLATSTITFQNTEALGAAQILANRAFGYTDDLNRASGEEIRIAYDWYFTAHYALTFDHVLSDLTDGAITHAKLNGNDDDGVTFDNIPLSCQTQIAQP